MLNTQIRFKIERTVVKIYNPIPLFSQKTNLTTSQDKAFRRIAELKEQIQLDKLAKQHIEENYTLMLEERGEMVKVLQTQVRKTKSRESRGK